MKAQDYLLQVKKLNKIIQNKLVEKEQWKTIALSTTAHSDGERVQSSGSQQKMADAVATYVEIEKEIDSYIDKLIDSKNEIIETIEQLDVDEYELLHLVYIQGKPLKEVGVLLNMSYTSTTTAHGRALMSVKKILEKRGVQNG